MIKVPETITLDAFDLKGSFTYSIRNPREGAQSVTVRVEQSGSNPTWLDGSETANCYIVTEPGVYCFRAVKGNTREPVGEIASVDVLWETYNDNSQEPEEGPNKDLLIKNVVCYRANTIDRIYFRTSDVAGQYPFWWTTGNALITAKDQNGIILWSWHIWIPKGMPKDQVYTTNGTMMDRNLGATSATPGDVGALGLLYQWGRKDPFMGASDIAEGTTTQAASTIGPWPHYVISDASTGTVDYAVANPTTYIAGNVYNRDWYYTGDGKTDNTRWQPEKTIYDPCPPGYHIPQGWLEGVWAVANKNKAITYMDKFDDMNKGFNFSSSVNIECNFSKASVCWYPAAGEFGQELSGGPTLDGVGTSGSYWCCHQLMIEEENRSSVLYFTKSYLSAITLLERGEACSVRCMKE